MSAVAPAAKDRLAELCRRYLEAQLRGDRREALRIVLEEGVRGGVPVADLQARVVQAAQREIGVLWQHNRITIAQEHMATAISQVVMSRLFEEARPAARTGRRVVVACVEGEMHEFASRLVADFLELGGFEVLYLGANVPTDDLLKLLRSEACDLLALSVTMSFNAPALRACVGRVRVQWPALPILVGGHALSWEPRLASEFGVETCPPDAQGLVDAARRLTERPA
jgi:methanogenic corrinoid protein MtbC1